MQKMFTDTVKSPLLEKDKTKLVIQEEWSKKRSKSKLSNRDNTINIKKNKQMTMSELEMSQEHALQTTDNQKHQKNVES